MLFVFLVVAVLGFCAWATVRLLPSALPPRPRPDAQQLLEHDLVAVDAADNADNADGASYTVERPGLRPHARVRDAFIVDVQLPALTSHRLLPLRARPSSFGNNARPGTDFAGDGGTAGAESDQQFDLFTPSPAHRTHLFHDRPLVAFLTRHVRRVHSDIHEFVLDERMLRVVVGRAAGNDAQELRHAIDLVRELGDLLIAACESLPKDPVLPASATETIPDTSAATAGSPVAIPALDGERALSDRRPHGRR